MLDTDIFLFLLDFYLKEFYLKGKLLASILCPQMEVLLGNGVHTNKLELGWTIWILDIHTICGYSCA